jgi:hypothetical protein
MRIGTYLETFDVTPTDPLDALADEVTELEAPAPVEPTTVPAR